MLYIIIDTSTDAPIAAYRDRDVAEAMAARLSCNRCRLQVRAVGA